MIKYNNKIHKNTEKKSQMRPSWYVSGVDYCVVVGVESLDLTCNTSPLLWSAVIFFHIAPSLWTHFEPDQTKMCGKARHSASRLRMLLRYQNVMNAKEKLKHRLANNRPLWDLTDFLRDCCSWECRFGVSSLWLLLKQSNSIQSP